MTPQRSASFRSILAALVLAVGALTGPGLASAQGDLDNPEIRGLIEVGVQLELARQWRDAKDHYSEALRKFPQVQHLKYGLRRSNVNFSIDRRYTDESFTAEINKLSVEESLHLYEDILGRIRGYYVEPISVTSIVAHGTESLWLALANQRYLDENIFGADPAAVQRLRDRLRRDYWNRETRYEEDARDLVLQIAQIAEQETGISTQAVIHEYVFGACNCLDDYSLVLTPDRLDDLYSSIDGEFVGIGIVTEAKVGQGLVLLNVLPDSPAAEAGLEPQELIAAIDGTDVTQMSTLEAAKLLTGPSGTEVTLTVRSRQGKRTVVCTRRRVEFKSVPIATMVDTAAGIGYIRLTGFQKSTPEEMDRALAKLTAQGMRKLIWDVRGNPGGLLPAAVNVLDRFIDDGVLVSTRGRAGDQDFSYSATRPATFRGELVLLIDGASASASEIVAGAIRDHRRGTVVGRKSFGKWSVQSIYPSLFASAVKLTTAKFYSPDGHNYGRRTSYDTTGGGLSPDVTVDEDAGHPIVPGFRDVKGDDPDVLMAIDVLLGQHLVAKPVQ